MQQFTRKNTNGKSWRSELRSVMRLVRTCSNFRHLHLITGGRRAGRVTGDSSGQRLCGKIVKNFDFRLQFKPLRLLTQKGVVRRCSKWQNFRHLHLITGAQRASSRDKRSISYRIVCICVYIKSIVERQCLCRLTNV